MDTVATPRPLTRQRLRADLIKAGFTAQSGHGFSQINGFRVFEAFTATDLRIAFPRASETARMYDFLIEQGYVVEAFRMGFTVGEFGERVSVDTLERDCANAWQFVQRARQHREAASHHVYDVIARINIARERHDIEKLCALSEDFRKATKDYTSWKSIAASREAETNALLSKITGSRSPRIRAKARRANSERPEHLPRAHLRLHRVRRG